MRNRYLLQQIQSRPIIWGEFPRSRAQRLQQTSWHLAAQAQSCSPDPRLFHFELQFWFCMTLNCCCTDDSPANHGGVKSTLLLSTSVNKWRKVICGVVNTDLQTEGAVCVVWRWAGSLVSPPPAPLKKPQKPACCWGRVIFRHFTLYVKITARFHPSV